MKNALYIDTYSTNHLHEMFDAASLAMFAAMYDHVEYRAAKSSMHQVLALLKHLPDNVSYSPIFTVEENKGWRKARRFIKQLQAILHNVWYIITAPKGFDIIINYNTLAALPMVNFVAAKTHKRVLLICHGELKEMRFPHSRNPLLKSGLNVLQKKKIADSLFLAVLGKSIYFNVCPLLGKSAKEKLLYFEHPVILSNDIIQRSRCAGNKLIIGTIGSMRDSKGLAEVVALAKRLKDNPHVEFRSIGRINISDDERNSMGIVIPKNINEGFLSRPDLYNQIRQLDYALFLFPPDIYKYTASGSVMDAIACQTPIIAIKNDYFTSLFSQYGEFGYLESNADDVYGLIMKLSQLSTLPHHALHNIQHGLNPRVVAQQFAPHWM